MPLWPMNFIGPPLYLTLQERDRLEIEAKTMRTQCGNTFEKDIGSSLLLLQALTDSEADNALVWSWQRPKCFLH